MEKRKTNKQILSPDVRLLICLILMLITIATCSRKETPLEPANADSSWLYQLQNAEVSKIKTSGFDYVVMDYSRDGTDAGAYSKSEIEDLNAANIVPICYISIGEAEDYRYYWSDTWTTGNPDWLSKTNPKWQGNYKVKYWDPEWQNIVYGYIDKIMDQGFAGIYLDIIDAFEYWSDSSNGESEVLSEQEAASRMIQFVKSIADYCRVTKGQSSFLIFPQNGERILDYDTDGSYLSACSGIGVEDIWYDETVKKTDQEVNERLQYLRKFVETGKIVLSVDYVDDGTGYSGTNKTRIDDYINKAVAESFIPYAAVSDRELDEINIIEGLQPR